MLHFLCHWGQKLHHIKGGGGLHTLSQPITVGRVFVQHNNNHQNRGTTSAKYLTDTC